MSSDRFGGLPKKGDLIEASFGDYKHWFLYVGDGYVVHMKDLDSKGPVTGTTIRALVRKELLPEKDGRYKYQINNKYDRQKVPLCAEEIVRRAEKMVGKEIHYGITDYNSEHFVTEMRYGVPMCDQDKQYAIEPLTLAMAVIRLLWANFGSIMSSRH